jgi:hypothetical protein
MLMHTTVIHVPSDRSIVDLAGNSMFIWVDGACAGRGLYQKKIADPSIDAALILDLRVATVC